MKKRQAGPVKTSPTFLKECVLSYPILSFLIERSFI
jgi:hypothetical protein